MALSLFLGKLLGLYMLIAGVLMLSRKSQIKPALAELISSKPLLLFSAFFDLLAGLAILIGHPVWEFDWRGLITLLGLLLLVRGVIRLAFLSNVQKFASVFVQKAYWIAAIVWTVLGLILTYNGFEKF